MPFIFHLLSPFKHVENSIRGIKRAARRHFRWIDLDILITKADPHCPLPADDSEHQGGVCLGHVVACHWDRPLLRDGFIDPTGGLHKRARVRDMTLPQVLRLRTKDGYRIRRIRVLMRVCAAQSIGAYVEPKDDPRFELDWPWKHMRNVARLRRVRLRARTIRDFPTIGAGIRRARAARRNGVRAKTIRG